MNIMMFIGLAPEMTMRIVMLMIGCAAKKEEIMCKLRLEDHGPHVCSEWLVIWSATLIVMRCLICVKFDLLGRE